MKKLGIYLRNYTSENISIKREKRNKNWSDLSKYIFISGTCKVEWKNVQMWEDINLYGATTVLLPWCLWTPKQISWWDGRRSFIPCQCWTHFSIWVTILKEHVRRDGFGIAKLLLCFLIFHWGVLIVGRCRD